MICCLSGSSCALVHHGGVARAPRMSGNRCHKLRQVARGSQPPGAFATNWGVSEVTRPHMALHLACSESESGHTPGDRDECVSGTAGTFVVGGLWTPGSAVGKPTEGRAQEGGPGHGRELVQGPWPHWWRVLCSCAQVTAGSGSEGRLGLLCPPHRAPRELPDPAEGEGEGRAPTAAAAGGRGEDLAP